MPLQAFLEKLSLNFLPFSSNLTPFIEVSGDLLLAHPQLKPGFLSALSQVKETESLYLILQSPKLFLSLLRYNIYYCLLFSLYRFPEFLQLSL